MPLQSEKWSPFAAIISMGHLPEVSVGIDAEGGHKAYVNSPSRTYTDFVDTWGLQRGDQVTFVIVQKRQGRYEVNYARIVLNPRNADVSGTTLGDVAFTAKVDGTGDAISPTSHDATGASFTGLNVAAGHSLVVYRNGTVWFTVTAQNSGGDNE